MLVFPGHAVYSSMRLAKWLARVQQIDAQITAVSVQARYFIACSAPLSHDQLVILKALLHEPCDYPMHALEGPSRIVVPRLGTISPWSSKATDISHVCGLHSIERIERGVVWTFQTQSGALSDTALDRVMQPLFDPMTETVLTDVSQCKAIFQTPVPAHLAFIDVLGKGRAALMQANQDRGLALSDEEINYLLTTYDQLKRNLSDVELMMFAQVNSEHCRHKIFRSLWTIDGAQKKRSLFDMIVNTYDCFAGNVLSAYKDNAAVIKGAYTAQWLRDVNTHQYHYVKRPTHIVMKVETHNHPTAIAPFPGAATGAGGEIRDEGATGRGARSKAGLVGFSVSHLCVPEFIQPWEADGQTYPAHVASALDIMLQAPIGSARFNNEFGRPNLCGYFRTFAQKDRGYHKPIMIAGGMGAIDEQFIDKAPLAKGTCLVVLGGPAMRIGLGGGAASSMATGDSAAELDFASVQRENPEMQRRAQEVITACCELGADNPILSVHDVGAGGLSNALPEIVHEGGCGALLDCRAIPSGDNSLSPLELWCNEAQERYVLAIAPENMARFTALCARERAPMAVLGHVTDDGQLTLRDTHFDNTPIDQPMSALFDHVPTLTRSAETKPKQNSDFVLAHTALPETIKRVLQFPAVASKQFLITIGDRSVGGLVARDQMVGPWQVPVADVAVTAAGFKTCQGEAMAIGERTPLAVIDAPASARMAVGEAITNIAAASITDLSQVKLSANWMAAAGYQGDDADLYAMVQTVGMSLCPALGICIPVGKDSMSMRMQWQDKTGEHTVAAPPSLIVSAFAPVDDVTQTLTPQLKTDNGETLLLFIDLAKGKQRLGGSAAIQVYGHMGGPAPDVVDANVLKQFFAAMSALRSDNLLLAYHDRSDGGLFTTLSEMCFAAHCGASIDISALGDDVMASLLNEELGAVIQIQEANQLWVAQCLDGHGLLGQYTVLGRPNREDTLHIVHQGETLVSIPRSELQRLWAQTSYRMQALRDNAKMAYEEFAQINDNHDPGLHSHVPFDYANAPMVNRASKPKVAILREQGVNGHHEMAAAFERAGFDCVDVHMTDMLAGHSLADYQGLAACGGFSYGDVLGGGQGWAKSILYNDACKAQFHAFFTRDNTFTLGVCNGCQMLAHLRELIPGADHWPLFMANESLQYEARLSLVEILPSASILFTDMAGARLPVVVAHGEGRAHYRQGEDFEHLQGNNQMAMRYVNNYGAATMGYPANPNGSSAGVTAFTSTDGRATIMMPHPERVFLRRQLSWHPADWAQDTDNSPWMRLFYNAYAWLG